MSSPMEIYLAEIPYEDRNQIKYRPALVVSVGEEDVTVFKVISKYQTKSKQIKKYYYSIQEWSQAGLNRQSYVDTHRTFTLPQRIVFKRPPLGKLTLDDTVNLFEFIKNQKDNKSL